MHNIRTHVLPFMCYFIIDVSALLCITVFECKNGVQLGKRDRKGQIHKTFSQHCRCHPFAF